MWAQKLVGFSIRGNSTQILEPYDLEGNRNA